MQLDKKTVITVMKILCGTILFAWCLVNYTTFFGFLAMVAGLLSPFWLGLAIAFVLNVPMRALERQLFSGAAWQKKRTLARVLCLLLTLTAMVLLLIGVFSIVVPQVSDTFNVLVAGMPTFYARLEVWGKQLAQALPSLADEITGLTGPDGYAKLTEKLAGFVSSGAAGNLLGSTVSIAGSVVGGVVNFFIGLIFAVYVVLQKEKLAVQVKKLLYAWCSTKTAEQVLYVAEMSNRIFSHFISGQCLEAVILGTMFFISMSVLGFPYAMLVAVLIALTALIPIFGAFIGCFVGAFLMLVQDPMQAVWFVVLFLALQQIEGNLIYPRVVGSSIGLPPMWVMVAVTTGGAVAGVAGMLLMVPFASVVYALLRENTNRRLEDREIPKEKYAVSPPAKPKKATASKSGADKVGTR